MDIKYLNYILTIGRHKNITKASEELYVSQSSLSQYLAKLEAELGTPLFFRAKGELIPTKAGELYCKAAARVIDIQKQLYRDIQNIEKKGHITVGTTSLFGLKMLAEIIPAFNQVYPDYTIEITQTGLPQLKKMLLQENIDLGIMAATNAVPFEEQSVSLRSEEIFFAVPMSHPYVKINRGNIIENDDFLTVFKDEVFIKPKRGSSLQIATEKLFTDLGLEPKSLCETDSINATRSMVSAGMGVSFIASSSAVDENNIKYYSFEPKLERQNFVTYRKNWNMNEAEKHFYHMLLSYFDRHDKENYRI